MKTLITILLLCAVVFGQPDKYVEIARDHEMAVSVYPELYASETEPFGVIRNVFISGEYRGITSYVFWDVKCKEREIRFLGERTFEAYGEEIVSNTVTVGEKFKPAPVGSIGDKVLKIWCAPKLLKNLPRDLRPFLGRQE